MKNKAPTAKQSLRIEIAEMGKSDLDEVMAIEKTSFRSPWTRSFFERELALRFSRTFLARAISPADEPLLGYAVAWAVADEFHVLNVAVDPAYRRQGVGRKLMERVIDEALCHACHLIVLEVRASGTAAQALYQSIGFRPVGIRPRYYTDNGEDAIVMVREV